MKDIGEGIEEFVKSDKPVVVLFHATWCPYCRAFSPKFKEFSEKEKWEVAEAIIDQKDNPLWDKYNIEIVPTIIVFRGGEILHREDGIGGVGLTDKNLEKLKEFLGNV